jgi:hypothetical protein
MRQAVLDRDALADARASPGYRDQLSQSVLELFIVGNADGAAVSRAAFVHSLRGAQRAQASGLNLHVSAQVDGLHRPRPGR